MALKEKVKRAALREGAKLIGFSAYKGKTAIILGYHQKTPSNWDGIDRKTKKIVRLIEDEGYNADIIFAFKKDGISLRRLAVESGLGFIGKSGLVITERFGPRIRFSGILTDAEIKIQKNMEPKNSCGDCIRCIVNCPSGAIEKKESLNCSAYTEGLDQQNCSICIDVCIYSDEERIE